MKKLKLLLSFAMMCLSIVVLCFGVLASTNVTYSISGTISYDITDVFAKINTKVFKVAGQTTKSDMQTNINTLATTALFSIAGTQTTGNASLTYEATDISIAECDSVTNDSKERELNISLDSTYMTYYIVINIQNLADKAISATLTDSTLYTNLNTTSILTQEDIAKGEIRNIIVAFSLADKKQGISKIDISYSMDVGYAVEVWLTGSFELETWRFLFVKGSSLNDLVNDDKLYKCDPSGDLTYLKFYISGDERGEVTVTVSYKTSGGWGEGWVAAHGYSSKDDPIEKDLSMVYRDC